MRKKGLLNILLQTSRLHSSCKSSNRFTDPELEKASLAFPEKSIPPRSSLDLPLLPFRARRKRVISGVITIPRIYIPTIRTAATHPRSRGREGGLVGRWMITPSYYLDAVELLCGETRGETRQRDVLGFLPIRITAAIVRPPEDIAEGTRKLLEDRHFRSAHRFVPVIMSSHRFRGWSILPLLPPPLPPLA